MGLLLYGRVSSCRGGRGSIWLCHCGLAVVARVGNSGVAGGNAYITVIERREKEGERASTGRLGGLHNAASCQGVDFVQHYVSLPFGFLPLHPRRRYQLRCSYSRSFNAHNLRTRSGCTRNFRSDRIFINLHIKIDDK